MIFLMEKTNMTSKKKNWLKIIVENLLDFILMWK
jgi:hypothetical protein